MTRKEFRLRYNLVPGTLRFRPAGKSAREAKVIRERFHDTEFRTYEFFVNCHSGVFPAVIRKKIVDKRVSVTY